MKITMSKNYDVSSDNKKIMAKAIKGMLNIENDFTGSITLHLRQGGISDVESSQTVKNAKVSGFMK